MSRLSYGYLVPCCEYAQMPPVPSITQETGGVLEVFDRRNVQRRTHQRSDFYSPFSFCSISRSGQ